MYLDGGDVERCGDTKNGHDDGLVLLVDEDLHFSDVLFSGHLRHVLIGHVRFSGPERKTEWTQLMTRNLITCGNPAALFGRHVKKYLALHQYFCNCELSKVQ